MKRIRNTALRAKNMQLRLRQRIKKIYTKKILRNVNVFLAAPGAALYR